MIGKMSGLQQTLMGLLFFVIVFAGILVFSMIPQF